MQVVFPRPLQLHRRAKRLRQQCRLDREIALRFAPETAAEQRHVHGDVVFGETKRLCDVGARAAGALHRRPDLGLAVLDIGDRNRRLHAGVGEMRQVVLADHDLVGALPGRHQHRLPCAPPGQACARPPRARFGRRPTRIWRWRRRPTSIFRASRPLIAAPVLRAITATPPSGWNFDGQGQPWTSMTFSTPDTFIASVAVERLQLAAGDRRAGNHRVLHAGQPDVGAVARLAHRDVAKVDDTDLTLAEVAEVLRILQLQAVGGRHGFLCGIGRQFTKAETPAAGGVDDLMIDGLDLASPAHPSVSPLRLRASCARTRRSGASGSGSGGCCANRRCPGCRT